MSIGTRLRPSTSSLKVPPWQGANAPVTQVGNMNPSPRGHGNCTTRTLGTTATLTHSPATLTETGPSITWHRLQDQARIGFLTRRSLRHRPHTLCEEDRRKGGNRRRGCEKGWQWKLRQHLIAPVPQGLKGRGLKQDRHRAPAPWAGGAWEGGGHAEPEEAIQEAVVVVGRQPVWAVRRPARACPRDKETPWLWGECAAPTREAGSDLAQPGTQGSGARQLASGCGRGAGCLGQGIQSLPARRGGTHFPGQQLTGQPTRPSMACSAASTPFSPGPGPGSLLPPTPALAWRPDGPWGPELL